MPSSVHAYLVPGGGFPRTGKSPPVSAMFPTAGRPEKNKTRKNDSMHESQRIREQMISQDRQKKKYRVFYRSRVQLGFSQSSPCASLGSFAVPLAFLISSGSTLSRGFCGPLSGGGPRSSGPRVASEAWSAAAISLSSSSLHVHSKSPQCTTSCTSAFPLQRALQLNYMTPSVMHEEILRSPVTMHLLCMANGKCGRAGQPAENNWQ